MQDSPSLPATIRDRVALLAQESTCLTTLVQSILDLSRLEGGRFRLNRGPVAVEPLLHRAVRSVAPNREVRFEFTYALPPAWADEIYVEQVAQNLLRNAVKYAPAGQPILVSAQVRGDELVIAVTDHGPGVPREQQTRLFDRFQRGARSNGTSGWGLGLYIARKLVEAHGSTIHVESPAWPADYAHPGTRFTFTLPLAREEEDYLSWPAETVTPVATPGVAENGVPGLLPAAVEVN